MIRKSTYDVVAFNSIIYDEFDGSAVRYPAGPAGERTGARSRARRNCIIALAVKPGKIDGDEKSNAAK